MRSKLLLKLLTLLPLDSKSKHRNDIKFIQRNILLIESYHQSLDHNNICHFLEYFSNSKYYFLKA